MPPAKPPSLSAGGLEADYQVLVERYDIWAKSKNGTFGPWGPYLRFDPERIADAVEANSDYLSWVGGEANAFKRAASLMLALERSEIVTLEPNDEGKPWPQDNALRVLEVANASAALDISVAIAQEIAGGSSSKWRLEHPPHMPSLHVFAEFARTILINFRLSQCGKCPPCGESVALLITALGLILEMCFYQTNEGIAGREDGAFMDWLIGDGSDLKGCCELLFMNMGKYADDPGGLCRMPPPQPAS